MESYAPFLWGWNIYINYQKFSADLSSLPIIYLSSHIHIYPYQYGFMDLHIILCIITQYCLLFHSDHFSLGSWELFLVGPCDPLTGSGHWVCFSWALLDFFTIGISRLILYVSCPSARNSARNCYFSKNPLLLFLENGIRNQDLGI